MKQKAEEEANKPWYEKMWDGIATFTGELTGYYDYKRTKEGIDPRLAKTLANLQYSKDSYLGSSQATKTNKYGTKA